MNQCCHAVRSVEQDFYVLYVALPRCVSGGGGGADDDADDDAVSADDAVNDADT